MSDSTERSITVKIPHVPVVDRFPFPFQEDSYRYSNNARALRSGKVIQITPDYHEEIRKKRKLLLEKPNLAYQSFSHSMEAQWEILELLMNELVSVYPSYFSLQKRGDHILFYNHLLDEKETFTFGDKESLACEPLDFIGRHVQEDLIYLGQRDGDLYMDAGQLCFPANWSIAFDLGMSYLEFHSPVPHFSESGLAAKVRNFLLQMEVGKPFTRYNWTITLDPILETFPETYDEWGKKKYELTPEKVGEMVHLRVEDQRLTRLPLSNGILFSIHTDLISMKDLIKKSEWSERFEKVLVDLPDYMAEYKGFSTYKEQITNYLKSVNTTTK
ncbi:DUF3445 domain-containing protein [Alkalihalobacillus sp. MEB130]|uniref:heme-dependent oxidative N-demethylase family protein n=1 Tax=Alkalihalobacillus sp. MEB130 TaxID=2976704 RepID=UPI0028E03485|nr:DUF3445 domain-containing protein [Alkalihalobacillus sp. MEB130]MDT8861347.1 DUF3445 domain-containing protein [Alkalihalobacillus sp. MEB130]